MEFIAQEEATKVLNSVLSLAFAVSAKENCKIVWTFETILFIVMRRMS
jgi:hypothetical protein